MAEEGRARPLRLDQIPRVHRITAFVVVAVILLAAAFVAGNLIAAPQNVALQAANTVTRVTAQVEERDLSAGASVQGQFRPGTTVAVLPQTPSSASKLVVESISSKPGESITSGSSIATVSGRPIFLLTFEIPPYRNLVVNDSGSDVSRLQRALSQSGFQAAETGRFDWQTQRAITAMYAAAGSTPPGGTASPSFDAGEILAIPGRDATVSSIASPGTVLSGDNPLAQVRIGAQFIAARVNVLDVEAFVAGASVIITGAGGEVTGTVDSVSEFREPTEGSNESAGHDLVISLPSDSFPDAADGTPVGIRPESEPDPQLAVPSLALRQDGSRQYVIAAGKTAEEDMEIDVVADRQSGGWIALSNPGSLGVGDDVLIAP